MQSDKLPDSLEKWGARVTAMVSSTRQLSIKQEAMARGFYRAVAQCNQLRKICRKIEMEKENGI